LEVEMLKIWNASNFRRTVGGLCLIAGGLLNLAGELIFPSPPGGQWTPSGYLAIATQQHDRLVLATYIQIVWAILFIPGLIALLHVIRARGVVLIHIGVILTVVGAALSGLVLAGFDLTLSFMGSPGLDSAAMTALLQKGVNDPIGAPLVLGFFIASFGFFLIGLAVWRSGFGYRWVGPLISIVIVAELIPVHNEIVSHVFSVLSVIGPVALGYRLLTMSDDEWESGKVAEARPVAAMTSSSQPGLVQ
jgi:hypothetical protein